MRSVVIPAALVLSAALVAHPQIGASRTALASVADPRNRPLVDIGADDFVIQEAGTPREILSIRPADYPIVILFDTAADTPAEYALVRKAVARFVNRVGQRPIAVGTLADPPTMITTFDDDRDVLSARLDAVAMRSKGGPVVMSGAAAGGRLILSSGGPMFSALVLITTTLSDDGHNTPDEQLAVVMESGAIVHVIANRPAVVSRASGAAAPTRPGGPLRVLAEQTHGDYTPIYSSASYQSALDRLAERLTTEMMVEYLVPPGSKPIDVKVGVRIPGARVRGLGVAPR